MSHSIRFHLSPLWVAVACGSPTASKPLEAPAASDSAEADREETGTTEPGGRDTDTVDSADTSDPTAPDTLEVLPSGPWCPDPADALAYTDIATEMGLVSTLDGLSARKEGPVAALDLDGDGLDELLVVIDAWDDPSSNVDGRFIQQPDRGA